MKKNFYFLAITFCLHLARLPFGEIGGIFAQNISINGTGATADPSAILDISSPNTGLLIPRIALTAINATAPITSPTVSLLVYNTATASTGTNAVSPGYYYWDGAKWVRFAYTSTTANAWNLLGNAGTSSATNFLGTTDNQDLVFKTNNLEAVRITTAGNVGIATAPVAKLDVLGNIQATKGLYINGTAVNSGGTSLILGNSIATENYAFSVGIPNNSETGLSINKLTGYTVGAGIQFTSSNLFRITNTGNVGINTSSPTEKLEVQGSVKIVDGTQGIGKVLTSDANGRGSWMVPSFTPEFHFTTIPNTFTATSTLGFIYTGASVVVTNAGIYHLSGNVNAAVASQTSARILLSLSTSSISNTSVANARTDLIYIPNTSNTFVSLMLHQITLSPINLSPGTYYYWLMAESATSIIVAKPFSFTIANAILTQ